VVTGAASGIGRALARELSARGAAVALLDRDEVGLAEVARELGALALAVDVRDAAAIDAAAARVEALGGVDLLFVNAGVAAVGPAATTPLDDVRWMIDVNVVGAIAVTRRFLPAMLAARRGRVVFTASIAGLIGAPGMSAYSASKFAVVGFAESLRVELAGTGVSVTVVCPGYVRTGFHRATRYHNAGFRAFLDDAPGALGLSAEEVARRSIEAAIAGRPLVAMGVERGAVWLRGVSTRAYVALAGPVARAIGLLGREA